MNTPSAALKFDDEIRLWLIDLRHIRDEFELLDDEERERATRFVHEADRVRFVRAHCSLRRTLAAQIDIDPKALVFGRDVNGRPVFVNRSSPSFNLSHSGHYALIGIAADRTIGVDVEIERSFDIDEVATLALSSGELRSLRSLPHPRIAFAFFDLWTRKEALLKADGSGLRFDLRDLDLGIDPAKISVRHEGRDWTVQRIATREPGVHAAVAVEGTLHVVPHIRATIPPFSNIGET